MSAIAIINRVRRLQAMAAASRPKPLPPTSSRPRTKADAEEVSPAAHDLLDFIPLLSPRWERPEHLAAIADLFARAEQGEVRALVSVPPQHAKTETILHGCAWLLRRHSDWTVGYTSYSAEIAKSKSRSARDYALRAGVRLRDDSASVTEWRTTDGGGMLARGIGGGLTSMGLRVLVIDDPHKDRADAESALSRQRVHDWYTSTARTRVHPGGSIIVCHTRWHEDDLIGRLAKEGGWEVINLPAIREDGSPLWYQRPISFLEKARSASEYDWHSLYMGSPRPRGAAVFRGAKFYDRLPDRYRIGKGTDLAYTAKTHADWSVGIVLLCESEPGRAPLFYVADVQRAQLDVPAFASRLQVADTKWPGPWHWFCSTTEKGVAQLLTRGGVRVAAALATADKFVRAQPVSTAWNEGRVLVPRSAPWLKDFVDEIGNFSGVGDRRDDQVDALASAFESVRHDRSFSSSSVSSRSEE